MRKILSVVILALTVVWAVPEAAAVPGCDAGDTTGCGGCVCEACVCEMDPYCCATLWDGICANECVDLCGGCVKPENCGEGNCTAEEGENCVNCPEDCACALDESCYQLQCCAATCDAENGCQSDGCGGTCPCDDDAAICFDGGCCVAACGEESGCQSDGCGGTCPCDDDAAICFDGGCCVPSCEGKSCGDDGCGGVCGECEVTEYCSEGFACEPIPPCEVKQPLHCDDVLELDTAEGINAFGVYTCVGWDESGPELGFSFDSEVDDLVVITVEETGDADHDIFLLEGTCLPEQCIDYSGSEVQFKVQPGSHYFLVVDGYSNDVGTLTLSVWCQSTCVPECDEDSACQDDGCLGICPCADQEASCYQGECCIPVCEGTGCDDGCGGVCPCEEEGAVCFGGECCVPSCEGKVCGDDGCGGDCGICDIGACVNGFCLDGPGCLASDLPGCGGCPCEACVCAMDSWCCQNSWDSLCVGECVNDCEGCADLTNCGDGSCEEGVGEDCGTCPDDCSCATGEVCGTLNNGAACLPDMCTMGAPEIGCCQDEVLYACAEGETFALDCATLEDNICGWYLGDETYTPGYYCGPPDLITPGGDPSGEFALECPACDPPCGDGEMCVGGECIVCVSDCDGKSCGSDGCGGDCGECPDGSICQDNLCATVGCEELAEAGCGGCACETCVCEMDAFCCDTLWDNICADACLDSCGGCPAPDPFCGDLVCNGEEDCDTCTKDCGCADGQVCDGGTCVDCVPSCDGLDCGDNGCGGSCGDCAEEEECVDGLCLGPCDPDCTDKVCGDDGCNGSCGDCADGEGCVDGACEIVLLCGNGVIDDGEECETDDDCGDTAVCEECVCVIGCTPDCEGKECGDDGCNGACGECTAGMTCENSLCIPGATNDIIAGEDAVVGLDVAGQDLLAGDIAANADVVGEEPEKKSDGCSTSGTSNSAALLLVLMALLAMVAIRRQES
jgi:hypothetical protein